MTIIVAGTMRVPPSEIEALRPHLAEVMAATRKEEGCFEYAFSFDAADPGLIRLFEMWTDIGRLGPHGKSEHIARYRKACESFTFTERDIKIYDIAGELSF